MAVQMSITAENEMSGVPIFTIVELPLRIWTACSMRRLDLYLDST